MTRGGVGGFTFAVMCGDRPSFVILGLTRDPGLGAGSFLALGPDFCQDDGGWSGWLRLEPDARCSPRFRHPGLTRDLGLGAVSLLALDPDFRQDDGGWGGRLRLCPDARRLPFCRHPGLDPGSRVAGGVRFWLWILTFVRMTRGGVGGFALALTRGACRSAVILGLTRDPRLRAVPLLALDPDFRQDDGGWGGSLRLRPDAW